MSEHGGDDRRIQREIVAGLLAKMDVLSIMYPNAVEDPGSRSLLVVDPTGITTLSCEELHL